MARSWAVPTMMLAVLLAAASALLAQEVATPAGSEVEATGYLSPVYAQDTYLLHLLNDEKTGAAYFARSEDVDLDSYDDGQRVDVVDNLVIDKGYPEPILQVAGVEPVEDLPPGETATLTFELSVEGETRPSQRSSVPSAARGRGTYRSRMRTVAVSTPDTRPYPGFPRGRARCNRMPSRRRCRSRWCRAPERKAPTRAIPCAPANRPAW